MFISCPHDTLATALHIGFNDCILLVYSTTYAIIFDNAECLNHAGNVNVALKDNDVAPFGETSDEDVEKPRAVVKPVPITALPRDKPIPVEDFIEYVKAKKYGAPNNELALDSTVMNVNICIAVKICNIATIQWHWQNCISRTFYCYWFMQKLQVN